MRQVDFQELVESSSDLVAVLDRDHRYIYVNGAIEQVLGIAPAAVVGRGNDDVMAAADAQVWRGAVDEVLRTGEDRNLECTLATPGGPRRFSSLLTRIAGERVCVVSRDVTDVRSSRVLDIAAETMATGMVIVEAPSGRVLFANAAAARMFGRPARDVRGTEDYDLIVGFDMQGKRLSHDAWPLARALRGEALVRERVEIHRSDGARVTVSITASPVRDPGGTIFAAVATIHDITEARRTSETAQYLAAAGALLEHFDPAASLQAIVDLATPVLADWAYVHLAEDSEIVAAANVDRAKAARVRALLATAPPLSSDTPIARVLAGGSRVLVTIDDEVLARAARDPDQLAKVRAVGLRSAVIAPLPGRDRVLGAITFAMAESGRRYHESDLDMLTELARRTGIALDNARLFAAEREARRHAEAARDRTRRLQALTAALSGATTIDEVVAIMVDAGHGAFDAANGLAWLVRGHDVVLAGAAPSGPQGRLAQFQSFPLATRLPVCDVIRSAQPMMFESYAAISVAYPLAAPASPAVDLPYQAHAVIPFVVGGRGVGAVSFAFHDERRFSDEDREMLVAMTGQASLALERCMLLDAERRARADAEAARQRERELHVLAARLSSALTPHEVAAITSREVVTFLRSRSGAAAMRVGDEVHVLGYAGTPRLEDLVRVQRVRLDERVPIAEAVARAELVWCASRAELAAHYPHLAAIWRDRGVGSWGAVPFTFEGRTIGSLAVAFDDERALGADEREFLAAVGQLAAQALERARLFEAVQRGEEQLRSALTAARAATWRIDLPTMSGMRDPSYAELLDLRVERTRADFEAIHPDDRATAHAHFERTLREGVPYEPEVRVRRGDGSYTWMRSHGRLSYGPDGVATMLAGVVVDIDEAKRTSLRAEEERRRNELENARLYKDVVEHKAQLETAIARAQLADRRKDEFLAMLGHELRNPLAPIATALELMELRGSGEQRKERDIIRRQVAHLSRLIDDLLDVSRITGGKIQLAREVVQIGGVLAKAVEMASPLLEKRVQRLAIDVPRDGLAVDADPTRLAQVFQNLLTNASKYSEPHTEIVLCARGDADKVIVEVRDRGIGIAPELMPRLFELFAQGERALDRSEGGLGIGLTIAKSLCELHGGAIEATSPGLGHGSTFVVTLPRAQRREVVPPARVARRTSSATARVLVVDDNVDAAETLQELLSHIGHEPVVAHDGIAALELATKFRPDIALLDIGLPVMDGYELARRLREQQGADRLRLIAVTGYGQDSDRARAREAGFDHHLVKPIELQTLMTLLARSE